MEFDIPPFSSALQAKLQHAIDNKTKPLGALGRLEPLALQLGLILATEEPELSAPHMIVFAADHGVAELGVSAFPSEVTAQMVLNFLAGGAAINCFCSQHDFTLRVVNVGVKVPLPDAEGLVNHPIAPGTADFTKQPAMTVPQMEAAMAQGRAEVIRAWENGSNVIGFGEMGIGNTTAAAAIMSAITGREASFCVGRGTGINDAVLATKQAVVESALTLHQLSQRQPLAVLAAVGGLEIASMVGAMLAAAERRMVILVDGFIASAATLIANALSAEVRNYMVFCHRSNEQAHMALLQYLEAEPLLDLGLRLGEGTGAALAYPLLQSATGFLNQMASFTDAGVSEGA